MPHDKVKRYRWPTNDESVMMVSDVHDIVATVLYSSVVTVRR